MLDLIAKNKEMLDAKAYNIADTRLMMRIASLKTINDYDLYLIACCLCNYDIEEKSDARELRMEYFLKTNNGSIVGFEHGESDYGIVGKSDIKCTNTGNVNKFGLYEYEINVNNKDLVSDLWEKKPKDCLKYVDNKTYEDKLIVSISKSQLDNFMAMLDELVIDYEISDLQKGLIYTNKSGNELIDISTLDLPFEPYQYQIEDAKRLVSKKRALLGHDMGCGKTLISILIGQSLDMPKLVICPESLRLNWLREIKQVKNDADVQILLSNETPHFGEDWTIVGYQTASKFIDNLMEFECIFVDECHNCKAVNNWGKPSSKRADAVITLANNAEYCYLLSGTPMPSHNKDLFNILKMLKCEAFDFNNKWAFKNYADKYCDPKETYFGMDYSGNSNSDMLHGLLNKLMIRRLKKDVLPHLTKQRQFIPIAPKFKKEYMDIEKRLYFPEPDDTYMGLAMTGRKLSSQYKVQTAIELAESLINSDESVVIVTNFIETADILKNHFKDKACEIRGGMSDKDKQNAIDDFQSKKKTVCILNMMAGGVGITLTASHTMIMVDYAWLPSDMTQVEDRICRSGQTENCMIYYIYCENSILDNIFIEMISDKSANIDAVVDNVENTFNLSEEKLANSTYIDLLKSKIKETKPKAKRGRKKKTE